MTRFEYRTERLRDTENNSPETLIEFLNKLGDEGWELVAVPTIPYNTMLVFKRKK